VQWTVFGEGTLCKRERPLKLPVFFFCGYRIISVSTKDTSKKREIFPLNEKISLYFFIYRLSVSKGTPSLAGRPLSKNSPLDCFRIHPLQSA
ncbi:MAG: hypothetical protein J6K77_05120, partial [Ruminococcus sp.]|nr:hypothetical protein [Ruminococcus sp.]